jgi:hypothetical protein
VSSRPRKACAAAGWSASSRDRTTSPVPDGAYRMTQQLQEGLTSRAVIDQAKGTLMAQHRVSAEEAFELLRRQSQRENRKLRELAQELVDRARQD